MKTFLTFMQEAFSKSSDEGSHATVVPLTGFSPHSHMGHAIDLGNAVSKLPGSKHIGISQKSDVFSPEERADILKRQWNQPDLHTHVVKSAGETISNAFNSLPASGARHLHLLVGADRKDFAEGLKKSLEAGKIKEMGDNKWDSITIHSPDDENREHGMSGTKMRAAAAADDLDTYHKHLGNSFSREEATSIMKKTQNGLSSGKIKLKR